MCYISLWLHIYHKIVTSQNYVDILIRYVNYDRKIYPRNNHRHFNHRLAILNIFFLGRTFKFNTRRNVSGVIRDREQNAKKKNDASSSGRLLIVVATLLFAPSGCGWSANACAPVLESTLTDLANYRAGSSAYLP